MTQTFDIEYRLGQFCYAKPPDLNLPFEGLIPQGDHQLKAIAELSKTLYKEWIDDAGLVSDEGELEFLLNHLKEQIGDKKVTLVQENPQIENGKIYLPTFIKIKGSPSIQGEFYATIAELIASTKEFAEDFLPRKAV